MASEILIVDDEADIRDLVAGILDDEGFTTRTARDSDTAMSEIGNRRPHLVFLDIWLQGSKLDGLQLLEQIKRDHPDMPVVMISGHGNIETAVAAIKRGAYDFIEKPFKSDAGARDLAAEARSQGAQAARAGGERSDGTLGLHESASPDHRASRKGQQPDHDCRTFRRGQGIGGAYAP
jgi:DNA-binding NtrC family response regulator